MIFPKGRCVTKRRFLFSFLSFFFVFLFHTASAQVPSDLQDLPIDPNALKNASSSQLQNYLKDYNNAKQKNAGEDTHKTSQELKRNSDIIYKDSTLKDSIKRKSYSPEDLYGADLFDNENVIELSQLSTPPPDYPIGVGDNIIVSLWGGADFEESYEVARDGSIFPQGLGKITVQGLTFDNARKIIYDRFRRVIPPSTNISVTLGQPRSILVQSSGEVQNPGPKPVSAFTNALNVIAQSGGITEFGNLRNILISRQGKIIDSIDIYKYLTTGDYGKHLYLENNDFVIVPFYDKKVLASGQFKRPMYYELKKDEGVNALIKYAGGFSSDAYKSGGEIIRTENEKQVIKTVNFNAIGFNTGNEVVDEPLYDGDVVIVNPVNEGIRNKVQVKGDVAYPGNYEIRKGDRLFDIINRAGGITPSTYVQRAYVYKGAGDSTNLKSDKIDVSLTDLNKNINSSNNIPIDPNDVIEIFNKNQFIDKGYVSIDGAVRKPGSYPLYGGMTLKDLLYFANGLEASADFGNITVSSVVNIDSSQRGVKPTQVVIHTYAIQTTLELDSITDNVKLKPYDQVFVKTNPTFHLQENVRLTGAIKYPATYAKLNKEEPISSFIERAGGLTEYSNAEGAILYRLRDTVSRTNPFLKKNKTQFITDSTGQIIDSVTFDPAEPISIDLNKALKYKNSKYDMTLQDGDVIYVPEINPIISVKGAVQSELKIYFDKDHSKLAYYIDKAGGFGVRPWRKRVYVTYANGRSRRTHNFGFFHFYPKVEAGSIVVVPVKPEGTNVGDIIEKVFITSVPFVLAYFLTRL